MLFLIVFIFFVSGCTTSSTVTTTLLANPYSVLTARDPSQHHLIDDFLKQEMKNRVGGAWAVSSAKAEWVSTEFVRDDAIKPQGFSLKMTLDVPKGETVVLESDLNLTDVSNAKAFSFWLKMDRDFRSALSVEISNNKNEKISTPLKDIVGQYKEWQEVFLDESRLAPIRLEGLKNLELVVNAQEKRVMGILYVDHFVFSGEPDLNLNSLADNLGSFPRIVADDERQEMLSGLYDERLLRNIAEDTWGYFRDLTDKSTHLPIDHVKLDRKAHIGDYTSPTNIGLYLLACIAAEDFKWLSTGESLKRLTGALDTLKTLPRWEGLFFNYYNTTNLQVTNRFVSSVDNAWLAASLVVVRQAHPELAETASALLVEMNFKKLYSESVGQFFVGYDGEKEAFRNNHYGLLSSETRILSYVAIGKGDVEDRHWFRLHRTLPEEWDWQNQTPKGEDVSILGQPVFEGYYVYKNIPIVPSWGGALFEFLMPTMLIDEQRLAPKGLGANALNAIRAHIEYAINEKGYPVWGFSPCALTGGPRGGYGEFGLPAIGSKGYKDGGIVTPHVTFLALPFEPEEALKNIRNFLKTFPIYGPYGFFDSVDVKNGQVCYHYLALDQGMILIALDNYLNGKAISKRFHADPVGSRGEPFLAAEEFYPGFAAPSSSPSAEQ